MIHLKGKTIEKRWGNDLIYYFFSRRSVLVPSKKFQLPRRAQKNGKREKSSKSFIVWQIIRLSSLVMKPLVWSSLVLCQESILSILPFFICLSCLAAKKKSRESFKLIFRSSTGDHIGKRKEADKKGSAEKQRIINQPRRGRERSLWIWIRRDFDGRVESIGRIEVFRIC